MWNYIQGVMQVRVIVSNQECRYYSVFEEMVWFVKCYNAIRLESTIRSTEERPCLQLCSSIKNRRSLVEYNPYWVSRNCLGGLAAAKIGCCALKAYAWANTIRGGINSLWDSYAEIFSAAKDIVYLQQISILKWMLVSCWKVSTIVLPVFDGKDSLLTKSQWIVDWSGFNYRRWPRMS